MKTDDNKQLCYMVNILMSVVTIANVTGLYSFCLEGRAIFSCCMGMIEMMSAKKRV